MGSNPKFAELAINACGRRGICENCRDAMEGNMIKDRSRLTTEKRNPASANIDGLDTLSIVRVINAQDAKVAAAVGRVRAKSRRPWTPSPRRSGGAAGCSTFGPDQRAAGRTGRQRVPADLRRAAGARAGHHCRGRRALVRSIEGAEDDPAQGAAKWTAAASARRTLGSGSPRRGLTPFVRGAIARARARGAVTGFVTCAPEARRSIRADIVINPVVGPEVVTGSTRMKAGTVTKLVLNTLTTAAMIRIGKVHGNLMVDLRATNAQTSRPRRADRHRRRQRGRRGQKTLPLACPQTAGRRRGSAKLAILMHLRGIDAASARRLLRSAGGSLRKATQ